MSYFVYDRTNIAFILSDEEGYCWNEEKRRWARIDPMEILGDEHAFEVDERELRSVLKSFKAVPYGSSGFSAKTEILERIEEVWWFLGVPILLLLGFFLSLYYFFPSIFEEIFITISS